MKAIMYKLLSKGLTLTILLALFGLYYYRGLLFPQWFEVQVANQPPAPESTAAQPAIPNASRPDAVPANEAGDAMGAATGSPAVEVPAEGVQSPVSTAAAGIGGTAAVVSSPTSEGGPPVEVATNPEPVTAGSTDSGFLPADDTSGSGIDGADALPATRDSGSQAPPGFLPPSLETSSTPPATDAPAVDTQAADVPAAVPEVREGPKVEPVQTQPDTAEPASQREESPAAASAIASDGTTVGALLKQARDAYWRGDYTTARDSYQQVILLDDRDPAPHGELGNVYFAQKDYARAAQAYTEAAYRLLAQDQVEEAKRLLPILQGLDEQKAQELHGLITQYEGLKSSN